MPIVEDSILWRCQILPKLICMINVILNNFPIDFLLEIDKFYSESHIKMQLFKRTKLED